MEYTARKRSLALILIINIEDLLRRQSVTPSRYQGREIMDSISVD